MGDWHRNPETATSGGAGGGVLGPAVSYGKACLGDSGITGLLLPESSVERALHFWFLYSFLRCTLCRNTALSTFANELYGEAGAEKLGVSVGTSRSPETGGGARWRPCVRQQEACSSVPL